MTYTQKKRRCADFRIPKKTCYTKKKLVKIVDKWNQIVKKWNKNNSNKKLKYISKKNSKNKNILWENLKNAFKTEREDLWLKFTNQSFLNNTFAPLIPPHWKYNKSSWLSDLDISNAMKFYEKEYNFLFPFPVPIDFDEKDINNKCIHSELCKYTYEELYKQYDYLGIIFNTDPHNKSGQHWIAMFIHLKRGEISFFDSTGNGPPKEVQILINRLKAEGKKLLKKNIDININTIEHQQLFSECGIYCLIFMHHMLMTDGNFTIFNEKRIPDQKAQLARSFFFDNIENIYPNL